ncbi:MAG: TMEM175 family protein [Candidatus Eisenbacteria bacterium]
MHKGRLEAFSDGVIAILITIMVLELKVPHSDSLTGLAPMLPVLSSYLLSFVFLGIYWNNHHHLLQAARHVDGRILWANMHLLFWLSLVPFTTAWLGEHPFMPGPVAAYGFVLLAAGCAYFVLSRLLIARHGAESVLARAVGADRKGLVSLALYAAGIGLAFVVPQAACALYVAVAVLWLVPDRRIERVLSE